jgi:hypothetical protein
MVTTEGRSMTKYSITRSPTYPSAVLKGAFRRQYYFRHRPQSPQRAIGIGKGQAAPG